MDTVPLHRNLYPHGTVGGATSSKVGRTGLNFGQWHVRSSDKTDLHCDRAVVQHLAMCPFSGLTPAPLPQMQVLRGVGLLHESWRSANAVRCRSGLPSCIGCGGLCGVVSILKVRWFVNSNKSK